MQCATRVESALRVIPGVGDAHVKLTGKTATLDVFGLNRAVEDSGYDLAPAMAATVESVDGQADGRMPVLDAQILVCSHRAPAKWACSVAD
jgi:hypothetical protein